MTGFIICTVTPVLLRSLLQNDVMAVHVTCLGETKKKLHGLSPRANYTDRATAACRRSDCQLLLIEGATWSAWRIPTAVFSVFWTGAATFLSSSSSVVLTRLSENLTEQLAERHRLDAAHVRCSRSATLRRPLNDAALSAVSPQQIRDAVT
jgi:hypothetical protein